jgi:lipoate-protein ligase A
VQLLDLTLPSPAENLALDEALLEAAESGQIGDILRIWEPAETFVVIGRSSRYAEEVNVAACQRENVPILRRPSGGAAVVTGPGCLMYSVIQTYAGREHLRSLDELHRGILGTVAQAVRSLTQAAVAHLGTCDLAIGGRKFSGNAVRCKRDHFLYHGTLLYNFDLPRTSGYCEPPRASPTIAKADRMPNL